MRVATLNATGPFAGERAVIQVPSHGLQAPNWLASRAVHLRSQRSPCSAPLKNAPESGSRSRRAIVTASSSLDAATTSEVASTASAPPVITGTWKWRGYNIRYQQCGTEGPAVLLIHGFGANCDHWRKNLPVLGQNCRAYAIDLLGYGFSDKPDPRANPPNTLYTFDTWALQLSDFLQEVVRTPAAAVCNSVGGLAGLQAAALSPQLVPAVMVINISLRMLHESKQSPLQRPLVATLQRVLRETELGRWFFASVAKPQAVRNILRQCYGDEAAVTDELVDKILTPGLTPGAVDVFLDFISYSGGPTPEQLMRDVPVPVSVVWGEADPWEKIEWGLKFNNADEYPRVEEFVTLPGVGHCPQDEAPDKVNPLIQRFVERHAEQLPAAA